MFRLINGEWIQVYLSPDTGGDGGSGASGDEVTLEDDVPVLNFEEEGENEILLEGVDEIPPEVPPGPTPEELLVEKTKLEGELTQLKGVAGNTQAINGLQEILGKLAQNQEALQGTIAQGQTPQVAPQPIVPYADFKKELTANYYNNPVENNEKLINYMFQNQLAPVLQTIQAQLQQTASLTSKQDALTDPMNQTVMTNYAPEVEAEAKKLQGTGDMNSYKNAIQNVKMNHIGDIVAKQVEEGVKKGLEEAAGANGAAGAVKPIPAGGNPVGGAGTGKPKGKGPARVLTKGDISRAHKMGLDISTKETRELYYEILQEEKQTNTQGVK